ncbi:hypothetical protein FJT64_016252 [Amphibalanus amphitrite]|uniref:Uncharacterized protein n=1 Tax=Amphibalanus amphitrite TaxID=1232801 RepID=A0A6A4X6U9_AMPAM|nr:hypothetical protein FJT64_016252 [Amphibalanus amphitrite]
MPEMMLKALEVILPPGEIGDRVVNMTCGVAERMEERMWKEEVESELQARDGRSWTMSGRGTHLTHSLLELLTSEEDKQCLTHQLCTLNRDAERQGDPYGTLIQLARHVCHLSDTGAFVIALILVTVVRRNAQHIDITMDRIEIAHHHVYGFL